MIIMESPATSPAIGSTASIITSLPPGTEDVPNDPGYVFVCIYDLDIMLVILNCQIFPLNCYVSCYDFIFRKMFIGGLSWQTTPGKNNPTIYIPNTV